MDVRNISLDDLFKTVEEIVSMDNIQFNISDLRNLRCKVVEISNMQFTLEETRTLTQYMTKGVEVIVLLGNTELDIEQLLSYDGLGKLRRIGIFEGTNIRYFQQLRIWANSKNWMVSSNYVMKDLKIPLDYYEQIDNIQKRLSTMRKRCVR